MSGLCQTKWDGIETVRKKNRGKIGEMERMIADRLDKRQTRNAYELEDERCKLDINPPRDVTTRGGYRRHTMNQLQ